MNLDTPYCGIPWQAGGRTRSGADCAGLASLWLREQLGLNLPPPIHPIPPIVPTFHPLGAPLARGDLLFLHFRNTDRRHVVICLGNGKFLNIFAGCLSRVENGLTLLRRVGFIPDGYLRPTDSTLLSQALADPTVGAPAVIILIAVAVVAMAASYALQPSLSGFNRQKGRYSQSSLLTQSDPELPLPDLLGSVVVAGNSVYQQLPDYNADQSNQSGQVWNQVIVLSSGPVNLVSYNPDLYIKGVSFADPRWHHGTNLDGIQINPGQVKSEAVTGAMSGDTTVPTVSVYDGHWDITVPVDVRAQYDRDFPLYGFSGCSYLIFRLFDSSKFSGFNVTARVNARLCRQFTAIGFSRNIGTDNLAQAAVAPFATRFLLSNADVDTSATVVVTVNGTAYTQMDATHQTGNVYSLNATKGYIEFPVAPAASAAVSVTYTYFVRFWSQNPAVHAVYLLTEKLRGKGLDESRIGWASAVDLRDYCDEVISWVGADASTSGPRFICNYAVDDRKPLQDHLAAVLNACNGLLFFSGGQFVLRARKATDASVFSFDASSIVVDSGGESVFEADLVDRSARINRAKLLFHSDQALQAEEEIMVDDEDDQAERAPRVGNNGIVDDNLKFPSVTTTDQAERLALMIVTEQVNSAWVYNFTTNIRGLALQPGDVIDVTHPCLPEPAKLLRVQSLEYDENDQLAITASEFIPAACI